jgi:cytochrome c biogenesis protein ResB
MTQKIWKFFCSVKLTVVLFILILVPSIIGTIIQQNAPDPSRYVEVYGPAWDALFRALGFYDVYHTSYFVVLLVLLGLNTFACTLNRFRPKWQLAGMLMTHCGLLLILLGALVGAVFGVKGFMVIDEGATTDAMSVGRSNRPTDTLPFKVRLVDFILAEHEKPDHKLMIFDVKTRKQQNHKIEEGGTIALSKSRWAEVASLVGVKPKATETIRVDRFFSHGALVASIDEGPEQTGVAAIEFRIIRDGEEEQGFALSRIEHPYVLAGAHLGVGYTEVAGREQVGAEIERVISLSRMANNVEVTVPGGSSKTYPAEVGTTFQVEGVDYSVKVLRYVPDFVIDTATRKVVSRSELPRNPALQVRITGPSDSKEQWIFAKFPAMHTTDEIPFELRYRRDEHLGDIVDYLAVLKTSEDTSDKPTLVHVRNGELLARTGIDIGSLVDIEGTDYKMTVDRFLEDANVSRKMMDRPDLPNRPAVEITLEQRGSSTRHYLWQEVPADVPGYRIMYVQESKIKDFFSILQIVDGEEVVAEKKIEVNDPLAYKGYVLYQSSYDSENLSWSGLQVKKDPGVTLVYGGFLIQILGMIIIFYVNPLVRKARKSRV